MDGPVTYRTWVWSSAVTRREEMMNRNLGDGPAVTATESETIMDVPADVRITAAGSPLAIRYDGRGVGGRGTAAVGSGDLVGIEQRVQVRLIYPRAAFPAIVF